MKKSRVLSLLIVLACLIGFSCKVGLGEAVDTVPPTVTITYPPAGAVVRDAFVLAGDCDDDTGVSSVDIYYERTGTYATEKAMLATVNVGAGEKRWSLTINPNEQDVKDGPYVFYAVARDTQGRTSGTYTQSFEVDNTAPVMILTKPTSFGSDNPKAYGRSISIEGTYAEATENRIDKLVVTFYNPDGTKVTNLSAEETTFNDITDMSNANPLIIAKLDTSGSADPLVQQRDNIYRKLYGTNDFTQGAKDFYFTVTAYDKARRYTDPSVAGGTGDGNATTSYYMGTNDLLNLINGEQDGYSAFSVKTIQELTSGLDNTYVNNQQVQNWLSEARVQSAATSVSTPRNALDGAENLSDERKAKTLNFSMNPANYPTFTVSGLKIGSTGESYTEGYFNYFSGTPLNFAIMAGLDQTKIAVNSVSIYVAKVDDGVVDAANKQLVWTWNPTVAESLADDQEREEKYTPTRVGENADSVSKTVALDFNKYEGDMKIGGSKWKFIVEGHDISGDDKTIQDYDEDGYGFFASISEQAATITVDPNEDKATNTNLKINSVTKKYDSFIYSGDIISSGITTMKYDLKITGSSSSTPLVNIENQAFTSSEYPYGGDPSKWRIAINIPSAAKTSIEAHPDLYNAVLTIKATNGGGTSQQTRTFNIDNDKPAPTLISFKKGEQDVYLKNNVYYLKKAGTNATTYELYGTTIDNYMIDKTEIKLEGKDASGNAKVLTDPKYTSTWYFYPNFTGFAAQTGENNDVTVTISALDKAGNEVEGSITFKVEFDDAAPVAKHELDALGKDLVFRIGDGVGGKYSPGTYGKTTTMKIRGNFEDGEGSSGVKMIYYQVKQSESALTLNTSNYSDESIYTGYFAPLATTKTASVSKNLEGGGKTTVPVTTGYEAVLTGFEEGNNYLRLVAVDNVGNAVLDQNYSLNVDLTVPSAESNTSETFLTNGDNASIGPITGTATDAGSGIGRIDFYVGDSTYKISADAVVTDTDDPIEYGTEYTTSYGSFTLNAPNASGVCNWTLTINNSSKWIKNISSNNINVYANVKDKAGLTTSAVKVATITKDTVKPTISIGDIEDKYTSTNDIEVNGKITTITGTAGDGNALGTESPILYYRTSDPGTGPVTSTTGWAEIAAGNYGGKSGTNPWTYTNVDTTTAFGSLANRAPVWLMASIVDKAGNTGYSAAKKIIVDQNTDRPVITFTDLENKNSWLQKNEIRGSISDDDVQVVENDTFEFKIYIGDSCPSNWSGIDPVATKPGSWQLPESAVGSDGTKKIWFYVKQYAEVNDTAGKEFISSSGSAAGESRPYYKYSSEDPDNPIPAGHYGYIANGAVTVKKDTTPPKFTTTLVAIGENANDYNESSNAGGLKSISQILADSAHQNNYRLNSERVIGGKESHFRIYVPIYDEFVGSVTAQIRNDNNDIETRSYNINGGPKDDIVLTKTDSYVEKEENGVMLKYYYYRGEVIDVSSVESGKSGVKSVKVTIKDQAENSIDQTCSFTLDNKGPTINPISPSQTDVVTGKVDVSGTSLDDHSKVVETYWMVPTSTQREKSDVDLAVDSGWSSNRAAGSTVTTWKFSFDGEDNPNLIDLDANYITYQDYVYTLPLYIMSVDEVGNYTIKKDYRIKHNPDADRPQVEITYPTSRDYGAGLDYVVLGGTILVTGNVQIQSGTTIPDAVYLQISTGSVTFDDYSYLSTPGKDPYLVENKYYVDVANKVMGASAAGAAGGSNYSTLKGFENDAEKNKWWGIKANVKGTSWNISLNENEKMNPAAGSTTNIWIRACGVNAEGKVGGWSTPVAIRIDANAPVQNASLRQYSGTPSASAHATASTDYVADMYIKGDWYLTVEMTDEQSLEKVEVKKDTDNGSVNLTQGTGYYLTNEYSEGGRAKRMLWIPVVPNTGADKVSYTVAVTDTLGQGQHITSAKYSINIDNTAPVLGNLKGNGDALANNSIVSEKDYVYTISGDVEEGGSGFERVLFYFVRPGKVLINPMVTSNAKVELSELQTFTVTQKDAQGTNHSYTMYGVTNISGTVQRDTFTPTTASQVTTDQNIKAGGLIFIEGVYRKISSIANNGTITMDTDTGITASTPTSVGFPYGMVIDNTSTEKVTGAGKMANPFVLTTDDGDRMPETVNKLGSTYTWDGTIHSVNLPDGPVDMVILAFDRAGNVSQERFSVSVQNNAPRLAKVFLGTDLNHNTTFEDSEFETYNIGAAANAPNGTEAYTLTTANFSTYTLNPRSEWEAAASTRKAFTVKKDLALLPEIVGGNGEIKVVFNSNDTTTGENGRQTGTGTAVIRSTGELTTPHTITGKYWKFSDFGGDGSKRVSFTFWDSTEECNPGTDSQYAFLRITDLNVDQDDDVDPNVVINPFFWNDEDDNSLYQNSKANGHIELESDWTATADGGAKLTSWDGKGKKQSTYLDSDPKVSGKIVLRGTAYDDTLLKTLQFSMTNFDTTTVKTFATYTAADGWTVQNNPTMASNYYEVTVTEDYLSQNGHKVSWEIAIDTAHLSDVAHIDSVFTVIALDDSGRSSANRTASETVGDATLHRPSYVMDVVPYITGLDRPDAKTNTQRSRMGKYQVVLGEDVTISGFNLPAATANAIKLQVTGQQNKPTGTVKTQITAKNGSSKDSMTFTVPATSGYIKVVSANNISSINNYNIGNEMESEYSGDAWTDDVYLSVWKNDEYFYFSNDPISPSMDRIANGNGQYRLYGGWATQGSRVYASYPYTSASSGSAGSSSYKPTGTGNAPNPAAGNNNNGLTSGNFGDPVTYYDVAIVGQNRYNIILDCWQGTTSFWGRNFVINKNGNYGHQGTQSNGNITASSSLRNVVERMGGVTAPDSANSSDGLDEIFNQFLNPRIAVYDDNYAYISYYDRYAKCLKWAVVGDFDNQNSPQLKYATEGKWTGNAYQSGNSNLSPYYTNGGLVVAGYDTLQTGGSQTNLNVGMWSDIAIDTNAGKPVIAYYDSTNRQLMIATSAGETYPVNTNSPVLTGTATSATQGNAWTRQVVTGSANLRLGEYVSLALDGGNNIHIACKGAKESCLYYVYGARTAYGTYTWTTVCVDNNGSPGTWTDIKLTNPSASGAAAGPVISYYDPTNDATEDALKVAYLESTASNAAENWDAMTVPCNNAVSASRITLALDVTDGVTYTANGTTNNSKLAIGYVSNRFDCVYLRKE